MKNKIKTQIFYIHGGMTFKNKKGYLYYLRHRKVSIEKKVKWSDTYLEKMLGSKFQIIRPRMPLGENAKYSDWKTHFERFFPHLKNNIILIGESLGGVFLAKYLSENKFPKKVLATYLVCPPFDDSLKGEDLVGGFTLKSDLSLMEKNSPKLSLYFSHNDDVVPVHHAKKYASKLKKAHVIVYKHVSGHFQISKFPEIIKMNKKDSK